MAPRAMCWKVLVSINSIKQCTCTVHNPHALNDPQRKSNIYIYIYIYCILYSMYCTSPLFQLSSIPNYRSTLIEELILKLQYFTQFSASIVRLEIYLLQQSQKIHNLERAGLRIALNRRNSVSDIHRSE